MTEYSFTSAHPWLCGCLAGVLFSALTTLLAVFGFFAPDGGGYHYVSAIVAAAVSFLLLAKKRPGALAISTGSMLGVIATLEIMLVQLGVYPYFFGIVRRITTPMSPGQRADVLTLKLHACIGLALGLLSAVAALIVFRVRAKLKRFSITR